MKTRVLVMLVSFLFAFNANYAVNVVKSTSDVNVLTTKSDADLTLKKSEKKSTKVGEKVKSLKLISKIKKVLGDANTVLLVILSLFPILALIAIYLKDGKSITLNFWIDLILHFLFLYWLFALLVVLDVINLA